MVSSGIPDRAIPSAADATTARRAAGSGPVHGVVESDRGSVPGRSSTDALRFTEPGFRTRTRTDGSVRDRPGPVADLGRILAVLARVGTCPQPLVGEVLAQGGRMGAE